MKRKDDKSWIPDPGDCCTWCHGVTPKATYTIDPKLGKVYSTCSHPTLTIESLEGEQASQSGILVKAVCDDCGTPFCDMDLNHFMPHIRKVKGDQLSFFF